MTKSRVCEADAMTLVLPCEARHAQALRPGRRWTWLAGRVALRRAARGLGRPLSAPITVGANGAPDVPNDVVASIAHKSDVAVGFVGWSSDGEAGIDVEAVTPPRPEILEKFLTVRERRELTTRTAAESWDAAVLAFSLKEAAFKCSGEWPSFTGFEVNALEDGTAIFPQDPGLEGRWARLPGYVLSVVRGPPGRNGLQW